MADRPTDAPDDNPYAAPELGRKERLTDVLQFDSRRMTFGESWQGSRNVINFLVLAACKLLRIRLHYQFALPRVDRLDLRDRERLPAAVLDTLRPLEDACQASGLGFGLAYRTQVVGPGLDQHVLLWRSDNGRMVAFLTHSCYRFGVGQQVESHMSVYTRLDGGRWLLTIDQDVRHATPPEIDLARMPGRPPLELLAEHRRRIESPSLAIVPIAAEELPRIPLDLDRISRSWYQRTGLLVPITETELSRLLRLAESATPPRSPHPWAVALVRAYSVVMIGGWLLGIVTLVIAPLANRETVPFENGRAVLVFGIFTLVSIAFFRHVLGMRPRPRAEGPRAREHRRE
ncbi:hypothetical protein [Tautonia marina]|uniref:hypothetical protein n=1 Tax=Tautonia marina TaxID=2653855 RepID=UPI0012610C85|nr:hypothetical protein [Tautonia marina]